MRRFESFEKNRRWGDEPGFGNGLLGSGPGDMIVPSLQQDMYGGNASDEIIHTLVRRQEQMLAEQSMRDTSTRLGLHASGDDIGAANFGGPDRDRFGRDPPAFGAGDRGFGDLRPGFSGPDRGFGLDRDMFGLEEEHDLGFMGGLSQRPNIPSIFDVNMQQSSLMKRGSRMDDMAMDGLSAPKRRSRFEDLKPIPGDHADWQDQRFPPDNRSGRAGHEDAYDPLFPTEDEIIRRPSMDYDQGRPPIFDRPPDIGGLSGQNAARLKAQQHLRNVERNIGDNRRPKSNERFQRGNDDNRGGRGRGIGPNSGRLRGMNRYGNSNQGKNQNQSNESRNRPVVNDKRAAPSPSGPPNSRSKMDQHNRPSMQNSQANAPPKWKGNVPPNRSNFQSRPNSTQPNRPNSTQPNRPNSAQPNRPNSTQPNRPNSTQPNRPSSTQANRPATAEQNRPAAAKQNRSNAVQQTRPAAAATGNKTAPQSAPPKSTPPKPSPTQPSQLQKSEATPVKTAVTPQKKSIPTPNNKTETPPSKMSPQNKPVETPEKPSENVQESPTDENVTIKDEDTHVREVVPNIVEETDMIGEYNPKIAVGQNLVVPVSGFFCKLCHKFYNNQASATVAHCQTKPHYDKVVKYLKSKRQREIAMALVGEFSETPANTST